MIFHAHELPVTIHSERQNADMKYSIIIIGRKLANPVEKSKGSSRSILDKFLQEGWKRRSFVVILLLLLHSYVFTTASMRSSRIFGQGVFGADIFGG
jgi:hypothetical protein